MHRCICDTNAGAMNRVNPPLIFISSDIFFPLNLLTALVKTLINPLLLSLRNSGEGCIIRGMWYGSFFYADDGTLLSTSIKGLQNMVTICESHADANDLMFSTDPVPAKSKTKCMAFASGATPDMPSIVLKCSFIFI